MNADIIVVSCGRINQLTRLFKSFHTDIHAGSINKILTMLHPVAPPDNVRQAATASHLDADILSIIETPLDQGWAHAINEGISVSTLEYIFFMNEDMECDPGALDAALKKHFSHFGNKPGILTFNDGLQGGYIACSGLINRALINTFHGELLHPAYRQYCSDVELTLRAKALDCYLFAEDINLWHRHDGDQHVTPGSERHQRFVIDEELLLERRSKCFFDNTLETLLPPISEDILYQHYLGLHLHRTGEIKAAVQAFERVLQLPTDQPNWYHAAAHAHLAILKQETDKNSALEHARKCLSLNPNDQRMLKFIS